MGSPAVLLLLSLLNPSLPVRGDNEDYAFGDHNYTSLWEGPSKVFEQLPEWLTDLNCRFTACFQRGKCTKENGEFQCKCFNRYTGKHCERFINPCKRVNCGRGECVLTNMEPFYECMCKPPLQPPNCIKGRACESNPCKNGGTCVKGNSRITFTCDCPTGFQGKLCEVGPDDCYEGDGKSYRGFVSETVDGQDCLPWMSHLIPFRTQVLPESGLGNHSYCRNPDGDRAPWCFIRVKNGVQWEFCNVKKCSSALQPTVPSTPDPLPLPQHFIQCGQTDSDMLTPRVFGGNKAIPVNHPWQVSLQYRLTGTNLDFRHKCGGTLIKSCWVLTAAHCFDSLATVQVEVGGVILDKAEPGEQILEVDQWFVHNEYNKNTHSNDIALLKLKGPKGQCAKESRYVKTACLPTGPLPDAKVCSISGWGATETGRYSPRLLSATVGLIPQDICKRPDVYGTIIDDSMLCAGVMEGGIDTCQGDSGGPLACREDGVHTVYGVVSWGHGCGLAYKPGVYARVTKFVDWIKTTIESG